MNEVFYVILSQGAYSDYSPIYFVGEIEITQEELESKGREEGDKLYEWLGSLPKRDRYVRWLERTESETYDPVTNQAVYSFQLAEKWFKIMTEWLESRGFKQLPPPIPELNVAYSDLPTNSKR